MNKEWFDQVFNMDALEGIKMLPDNSVDLVVADPPYNLGKDYGNDSDKQTSKKFLLWTEQWLNLVIPKIKETGSLYIFTTWRYSPVEVIERMIKASCPKNGIVLDPFLGSGTTAAACLLNERHFVGFELNTTYYQNILSRLAQLSCSTIQPETEQHNIITNPQHSIF